MQIKPTFLKSLQTNQLVMFSKVKKKSNKIPKNNMIEATVEIVKRRNSRKLTVLRQLQKCYKKVDVSSNISSIRFLVV